MPTKKADDPVFVIGKRIGARINDIVLPLQIRLQHSEFLRKLEQKTHVKRHFVVLGIFVIVCLLVFAAVGSYSIVLCNHFLTSLLPLYLSFKSLPLTHKHATDSDNRPAMFWLCYWIFYMMTEQISLAIHWLSLHEDAWWIVSYVFVTVRFCALCLCVLADSELRDILYRQLIGVLSHCAASKSSSPSSLSSSSRQSNDVPSNLSGSSLEEGLSRRNVVKTGGMATMQQEKEKVGGGDITRRMYETTGNPYNKAPSNNPYNSHVAT